MKAADTTPDWAKVDGRNRWRALRPGAPRRTTSPATNCPPRMPGAVRRARVLRRVPAAGPPRATAAVIGVEALVRWQHPQFGRARPGQVHRAGRGDRADRAARPLGAPAGRAARRAQWRHAHPGGADLSISVNLAARQVRDRGLVADIATVLARHRPGAGTPAAGAHRERHHGHHRRAAGARCARSPTWACGSPSTTSAPGTPTSPTCATCRCTRSSSPARSSHGLRPPGRRTRSTSEIVATLVRLAHALGLRRHRRGRGDRASRRSGCARCGCDTAQGWYYAQSPGPLTESLRRLSDAVG